MQLGLETFSYHLHFGFGRMEIPGFIRRCAELGLDGAQLNLGQLGPYLRAGGTRQEVRELAVELGLWLELDTRGTDPQHLTNMLHLCDAVGADVLRTYASCGGVLADELAQAPADLRAVVPLCQELGVRIAFENHEYETSADILRVVEQVGSGWVGTHVDTGNSMMVWEDPAAATRALAPLAVTSHLKDHVVIVEDGLPLVVGVTNGTGTAECAECFRILCEESPLQRVVIEVCYGYSAPFRRPESKDAGGRLGEGAFRVVEGEHPLSWLCPHPGRVPVEQREELLAWQEASVAESLAFVRSLSA